MEISKIAIKNFKGLEYVEMSPIKHINVLIGRNNSGKSSVLKALEYVSKCWGKEGNMTKENPVAKEHVRLSGKEKTKAISIYISVRQTEEEQRQRLQEINESYRITPPNSSITERIIQAGQFSTITYEFTRKPERNNLFISDIFLGPLPDPKSAKIAYRDSESSGFNVGGFKNLAKKIIPVDVEVEIKDIPEIQTGPVALIDRNFNTSHPYGEAIKRIFFPTYELISKKFNPLFLVGLYRHAEDYGSIGGKELLDPIGSNLVDHLAHLQLDQNAKFQRLLSLVKKIEPEIGRFHSRTWENQLELACEWGENEIVKLVNMGGGLEQIIILVSSLMDQKKRCILWEEPESHLHPGAQDALLGELEEKVGDRIFFITTHSPVFVRNSDKIAVHVLTNPNGRSATGRTIMAEDFQEAMTVIGSRPGHLAQADIVVYVEGKRGADAVREWLNKWPERNGILKHLRVEIQPLNADEIGGEKGLLESLQKINPNLIIFVDRDSDKGKKEPKKSRKILKKDCSSLGIPCIITEERQIEDYFTLKAIEEGLPSNLWKNFKKDFNPDKKIGEQIYDGWKRYNQKIADAMDWTEIGRHKDIMKICKEIINYASRLKPENVS